MDVVVKSYRPLWDRAGIVVSALCLLHCLAAPVAAALAPTLGLVSLDRDWVHPLFAVALALIALAAFLPGYRRHRDRRILLISAAGLALVVYAGGAEIGDGAETLITVLGSGLLLLAHGLNRSFCHRCEACRASTATDAP